MSTFRLRSYSFPVAPPSPSAGGHEMRDYSATSEQPQPFIQQPSQPLPYLGLTGRLSQVWINRWTILLLLVLVRTLFAIASLDHDLGNARQEALSACTSVENVGSALASMPHYLSGGVNELSADGIEKAIHGLVSLLTLTVTGVEEMVVYYVNTLIGTYVCLITFAVGGSLHIAIDVAEDVGGALNQTVKSIGGDLSSATADFQSAMNGFLSDIDKLGNLLTGKNDQPPTIDLTGEINSLNGLQIPPGYDQGLSKLNASIPTFADVKNFTETAVRLPFEEVRKLLNESLPNYTMNRSLFPVPTKEQLTFCSDNNGIDDFFDDLIKIEHIARKVFIVVLLIAAVLACAPMAYRELRRWRSQQARIQVAKGQAVDDMDAVYIVSRPYTAATGLALASRCSSPRRKAMVRYTVAYATTVPALFVLSLALAGLFACLCQYILLKAIEKEVPALVDEVGSFADKVLYSLNNASEQWAIGTNHVINDTNTKINHDVFGWVNTTTTALNNTLNVFVDGMMTGLNTTFGGTPLYEPVLEVLNCLILLKVQGIEKALTWVSDNAYVTFPEMPVDTFSLGAMQQISQGGNNSLLATGPAEDATDAISAAVVKVVGYLQGAIRQEAIVSTSVLMVWVLVVLIGLVQSSLMVFKKPKSPVHEEKQTSETSFDNFLKSGSGGAGFCTNLGRVDAQPVKSAVSRPSQVRSSSHGDLVVTTPVNPTFQWK